MVTKIKKNTLVPGTFLLLLTIMMSSNVRADSSVTITLQGLVNTNCFATFQTAGNGQNLDLTLDTNDELVADGTVFCNDPLGFKVSLTSKNGVTVGANSGIFIPLTLASQTPTNRLPYSLNFLRGNGSNTVVIFDSGVAESTISGIPGDAISDTFKVEISYVGNTLLTADSYTDDLTLTIGAP